MTSTIQFVDDFKIDVHSQGKLTQLKVHKGEIYRVYIRPVIVETSKGFIETANLTFVDGSYADKVMYETFIFYEY